jgi:hypothetical protein
VALLQAVTDDEELPVRLLLWAGADPHRKVPMIRELGRPDAWDDCAVFSAATAAITFGRPQLLNLLRVETMPDLEAQTSWSHDSWTLRRLVAVRAPSSWSAVILAFIGRLWRPLGINSAWDVRNALGFIASNGGMLVTASSDEINYLRHVLLKLPDAETFLWLLKWLKNEKHCSPTIYEAVTRTASMHRKIEALGASARYLTPSARSVRQAGPTSPRVSR